MISIEQDVLVVLLVTRTSPGRWSVEISGKGFSVPASGSLKIVLCFRDTASLPASPFRGWYNKNTEKQR